ncbi:hypothetical protein [Lentzea sp. NPDC092896]|uniref:hypothetical protein n=1 Tax=Lentzea sp. NPDC092896 TaxID=3364127 RepID=UPI003818C79D
MDPDDMSKLGIASLAGLGTGHGAMLAAEMQRGLDRRHSRETPHPDEVEIPENVTFQADLWQYIEWLRGYTAKGGRPTHSYDYEFKAERWRYAPREFAVNGECGSRSTQVILGPGAQALNPNPWKPFGGFGHNNLYWLDDFKVIGRWVPIYSNPEFDEFRGLVDRA